MFPPHCVAGSPEVEVIPELAPYPGEMMSKTRFSAFTDTFLKERLEALQPEKLIICGVCTDICVLHTVSEARSLLQ